MLSLINTLPLTNSNLFLFSSSSLFLFCPTELICQVDPYECLSNRISPLSYFDYNRTVFDLTIFSDDDLLVAISANTTMNGNTMYRDQIFGNVIVDNHNQMKSADSMMVYYKVPTCNDISLKWLLAFTDHMETVTLQNMNLFYFTDRSISDGLSSQVIRTVPLLIGSCILMLLFTWMMLTTKYNVVSSRLVLALRGFQVIILGIIAGFGLCAGFGALFTSIHPVLPFLIFGVGIDDIFIITSTFDSNRHIKHMPSRLSKTMETCGLSITYTTVTDAIAFLVGSNSALPAIRMFCYYAAAGLVANFLLQITVYCAFLVYDEERQLRNEWDVLYMCSCRTEPSNIRNNEAITDHTTTSTDTSEIGSECANADQGADAVEHTHEHNTRRAIVGCSIPLNSVLADDEKSNIPEISTSPEVAKWDVNSLTVCKRGALQPSMASSHSVHDDTSTPSTSSVYFSDLNQLQRFLSHYYFPIVANVYSRSLLLFFFIILFGVSVWSCATVPIQFDIVDLLPDDYYARTYILQARFCLLCLHIIIK